MSTPAVIPFLFKFTHPTLYAHSIVIQAEDYASAASCAQAHCVDTLWVVTKVTNMLTGEVILNG